MTGTLLLPVLPGSDVGTGVYLPGVPSGVGGPGALSLASPGYNAETGTGSGWEISVLAAPDFSTFLAWIPGKMLTGIQFVKQIDAAGSGTVTLDMDDSFWDTILPNGQLASYLLDWEHDWQVWLNGVLQFEFLGETVTEQLVDPSEQRIATVTGPGTLQVLSWGAVMPNGFPDNIIYKLDAITEDFDEVDEDGDLAVDTELWNASSSSGLTLNPIGSCQIMGSADGTFLGSTAYDATMTLISAEVTPIVSPDINGNTLNGSQVTQFYIQDLADTSYYMLIGLSSTEFYWQYAGPSGITTHIIATADQFNSTASGNENYSYWQISENNGDFYIWTSPDGQNWTQQGQISHAGWSPTNVGLYFSATYSVASAEYATVTAINSNVTTSSLGGPTYYNEPIMSVWLQSLQAAQARGTVPFVSTGLYTDVTDSFGNVWSDSQSVQLQNGTDLLSLLAAHASCVNADYIMQPGFRLQVGLPVSASGSVTIGTDRSAGIIFHEGREITVKTRTRARNQIQNLLGVINADGRTVSSINATSAAEYGQREGWIQAAVQVSEEDLEVVAAAADQQESAEILSYTCQVLPYLSGRTIFIDFQPGDWIGMERPDFSAVDAVRVIAIAVQVAQDGSETHELTLESYTAWLQEQLSYIATKLGGGYVNVTGTTAIADNGSITNLNAPTVFSIGISGLSDVAGSSSSGANAPLVYDPVTGLWVPAGSTNAVTGVATPVAVSGSGGTTTIAGDGSGVSVSTPVPASSTAGDPGETSQAQVLVSATTTTVIDAAGTTRTITGAQSDGTYTSADFGGPAPATPDTPTASGTLNGIIVGWDGLLDSAPPLSDFLWTEVHVSTSSGFTPSGSTLKATMAAAGLVPVMGLVVGDVYYVKLLARNTSDAASSPSAQSEASPTGLSAGQMGNIGVLNDNPYFTGGDGTGWNGVNGSFSVTESAPSGSPYTYAGEFQISTSGVGAAAKESGDPFPVVAGAQYLATAWASTPTTEVVLGFDFFTGPNGTGSLVSGTYTQAFTVTADTWTSVTAVITAPATAVSGWLRIAPEDGTGNIVYFEAILALPQVPGGLVQAGTITATQIAAATITAAQIAASTITATQIAANTITASQIAAATITASQIAAGTITTGLIAAGAVTASQIAAGTVVAGIVDGTTIEGAQFIAYGSNGEILIYSGTVETGALIGSWSAMSGVDAVSNDYPAGLGMLSSAGVLLILSPAGLLIYNSSGGGSGNLTTALTPASGSDPYSNDFPAGLLAQQLTLPNQSGTPAAFSSASVFYSSTAGRPRYLSSAGANDVLDRSDVNVSEYSVGSNSGATQAGAGLSYLANEASASSEYEVEIFGAANWGSTAETLNFEIYIDGSGYLSVTVGAAAFTTDTEVAYTVRGTISVKSTGSSGDVHMHIDGGVSASGGSELATNTVSVNADSDGFTMDTTSDHTIAIYAWWGASEGQSMTTFRTRTSRHN